MLKLAEKFNRRILLNTASNSIKDIDDIGTNYNIVNIMDFLSPFQWLDARMVHI